MNMFDNYQNISPCYIPDNRYKAFPTPVSYTKLESTTATKPYELYNAKGELEGYYWYQGNQLILDFSIDGELTVESNSIIYTIAGQTPDVKTEGRIGQRLYNIIDYRSWTCVGHVGTFYVWQEDAEFTYPVGAERSVFVDATDYMKDKTITFTIYDFRMEPIYNQNFEGSTNFKLTIDEALSKKMVKGVYYCSLEVAGKTSHQTLFSAQDCKLLVK